MKTITSLSHHNNQSDNTDDRLSMFANDSSTIITKIQHIQVARECIHNYEKGSCSELHEGKTKIMQLGKAREKTLTQANMKVNFTVMKEGETENYLGGAICNEVTEKDTFDKVITSMEKLGSIWLKEHIGSHGHTIVANTLLQAKLAHRASVNGISEMMGGKIKQKVREFVWGGEQKKARVRWEIMIKQPKEGGTGLRDPVMAIDARRINILKKMITRDRQPWMRWIERKLKRVATRWKVSEAMAAKPKKREIKT